MVANIDREEYEEYIQMRVDCINNNDDDNNKYKGYTRSTPHRYTADSILWGKTFGKEEEEGEEEEEEEEEERRQRRRAEKTAQLILGVASIKKQIRKRRL